MLRQLAYDTLNRLGVVIVVDKETDRLIGRLANVLFTAREVDTVLEAQSIVFGAAMMVVHDGVDLEAVERIVNLAVEEIRSDGRPEFPAAPGLNI